MGTLSAEPVRRGALLFAALLVAAHAGCGKKAPLRLPEDRPVESARAVRARVRERAVVVSFRVPARRVFPEREEPWVLARIQRRTGEAGTFEEVGTVHEEGGLPFDGELTWRDEGRDPGTPLAYRVEFRDAARRRRALTPVLELSWPAVPSAPRALAVLGGAGAVRLGWEAPEEGGAGARYRVYRRSEGEPGEGSALDPLPPTARELVDTRVQEGKSYCYRVRALAGGTTADVEGPAGEERCAATQDAVPPPAPTGLRVTAVGGAHLLAWEPVAADDLGGYRVWRAAGEGSFELLTPEPVAGTAWRDDSPAPGGGATLRWAVTAVDRSPLRNESPFSAPATLPAPQ